MSSKECNIMPYDDCECSDCGCEGLKYEFVECSDYKLRCSECAAEYTYDTENQRTEASNYW